MQTAYGATRKYEEAKREQGPSGCEGTSKVRQQSMLIIWKYTESHTYLKKRVGGEGAQIPQLL